MSHEGAAALREWPTSPEVVVVGAGLAGLTAAWALRDREVVVLEAGERIGGRIRSERRGDYWLSWGAHVFGGPGTATGRLLDRLGVESVPVPGSLTAVSYRGALVASGPVETYPFRLPLSTRERAALVRAGLKIRLAVRRYDALARERPGDTPAARRDRTLSFLGDRSFADWLGRLPAGVEGLFRPTITRSSAEPDELAAGHGVGYFHLVWRAGEGLSRNLPGGPSELTGALAAALGDRVRTGARVTRVERYESGVRVLLENGEQIEADQVVMAAPAYAAAEIVRDLPGDTRTALRSIPYGPYVVVSLLTGERGPMPWDGLYAVATPGRAFNMIFNLASILRGGTRAPGGSLMLYSGGRALAGPLLERSDDQIVETYLRDLELVFPGSRAVVEEAVVQRWPRALPFPRPGRIGLQPALDRPLEGVVLAGDYLGNGYTETAVQTGLDAAARVRSALTGSAPAR